MFKNVLSSSIGTTIEYAHRAAQRDRFSVRLKTSPRWDEGSAAYLRYIAASGAGTQDVPCFGRRVQPTNSAPLVDMRHQKWALPTIYQGSEKDVRSKFRRCRLQSQQYPLRPVALYREAMMS